jgi:hypothetical protein
MLSRNRGRPRPLKFSLEFSWSQDSRAEIVNGLALCNITVVYREFAKVKINLPEPRRMRCFVRVFNTPGKFLLRGSLGVSYVRHPRSS